MKIVVDRSACEGNSLCVAEAPDVFDMDDNNNLVVLKEVVDDSLEEDVAAAIAACPKRALSIARH